MFGHREVVATCTWEWADLQTAATREQSETVSQGVHATRLLTELQCAHWNQTETGSSRACGGS